MMDKIQTDPVGVMKRMDSVFVAGYRIMGRLNDVPCTTEFFHPGQQSCAPFNDLFGLAYQSGAIGYCFQENGDHASTSAIPDEKTRLEMADMGQEIIEALVQRMNVPHVVEQMKNLEQYNLETEARYPWMPSAWNKAQGK